MADPAAESILIFAPTGRDGDAAAALLRREGFDSRICSSIDGLCDELDVANVGAVIAAEEGVAGTDLSRFSAWIAAQQPWSDLPVIVLTGNTPTTQRRLARLRLPDVLGNVVFLERPLHAFTLISAVRAAVRARRRQYQVRDHLLERETAARHQQLLINELNHRVKNSLATVQAIARQTFRGSEASAPAQQAFTDRLIALARAHDILTEENWEGADLADVVASALDPYGEDGKDRLGFAGPPVRLSPKAALALAMVLHELATNAAKYGALAVPEGRVDVDWAVDETNGVRRLRLRWEEKDGPAVQTPAKKGFGSRLIERGLAWELQGEARLTYRKTGVVCTIEAPLPDATREDPG